MARSRPSCAASSTSASRCRSRTRRSGCAARPAVANGDRNSTVANFYFGGFGNNYVDDKAVKRYREYDSLPGFGIDEVSALDFVREMGEWNLPPYVFESAGTPGLYLTWLRPSLFAAGLWSDPGNTSLRKHYASVGGQVDLYFSVLHRYDMTLSAGYAVGLPRLAARGQRVDDLAQDHVAASTPDDTVAVTRLRGRPVAGASRFSSSSSTSTVTSSCRLRMVLGVVACGAVIAAVSYAINAVVMAMLGVDAMTLRALCRSGRRGAAESRGGRRADSHASHRLPGRRRDLRLRGRHRVRDGREPVFPACDPGRRHRDLDRARVRHGIHARRRHGDLRHHGAGAARACAAVPRMIDMLPGFALAVVLHMGYNHLSDWPRVSAVVSLLLLAPLLYAVFRYGETALGDWLGQGFDADAEMLELINSGRLSDSPVGRYLTKLKGRFRGPVVADLLCYLRVYTELALRAKGMLLMRESGFDVPIDEATQAKFEELHYLETSIGKTGLRALKPIRHVSDKELWQLNALRE